MNPSTLGLNSSGDPWFWQIVTVVLAVIVVNVVAYRLLRHIEKLATRTPTIWDDALIRAARRPVTLLLWTLGAALALRIVHQHIGIPYFDMVGQLRNVLVVLALAWLLIRLINNAAENLILLGHTSEHAVDRTTVDALSKLGRICIVVVSVLTILQTLGVSIAGVLAFGGVGGIAIGFAAKDLFANLLGGLTIYLDRPFSVGEWIRSPDKAIEGTVEQIGWRNTRIRAFNKNPIYVPNALFTNIVVENPSRMTNRRIKETIGLRYQDLGKMAAIVAEVKEMLHNHPDIDTTATLIVNFNGFGASSLDFFIYTFTRTVEWAPYHVVKQDVLLKIADIIAAQGAEIAYPTRSLFIESGSGVTGLIAGEQAPGRGLAVAVDLGDAEKAAVRGIQAQ
jgi:MscS family membrane protein